MLVPWTKLSVADGVSTLQLQSSRTRLRHGCALHPLVVDNSDMGLKLTYIAYSYKHTVYLLTYLHLKNKRT